MLYVKFVEFTGNFKSIVTMD